METHAIRTCMQQAQLLLGQYKAKNSQEQAHRNMMVNLLRARGSASLNRACLPGHFTASAWVIHANFDSALLLHHAKLDMWLQPGGHCDGESDLIAVAEKEVEEETGLKNIKLLQPGIFDLDIHLIPARNTDPWHYHYDIRFLFQAAAGASLRKNHESHALAWVPLTEIITSGNLDSSIIRMAEKSMKYTVHS